MVLNKLEELFSRKNKNPKLNNFNNMTANEIRDLSREDIDYLLNQRCGFEKRELLETIKEKCPDMEENINQIIEHYEQLGTFNK